MHVSVYARIDGLPVECYNIICTNSTRIKQYTCIKSYSQSTCLAETAIIDYGCGNRRRIERRKHPSRRIDPKQSLIIAIICQLKDGRCINKNIWMSTFNRTKNRVVDFRPLYTKKISMYYVRWSERG